MKSKPYRKYSETTFEWLGKVPHEWKLRRLKYCVDLINEKADEASTQSAYIGLENIESWTGKQILKETVLISEGQPNQFRSGDILFNKLRPYLAKVLRPNYDGACTGELLVLRPKNSMRNNYLFYYLLSKDFINAVDSSTYGSKMPRANWEFIGCLPMLIPPYQEQLAIVDLLEKETNRIEKLIIKKQHQIELLQEKCTGLISQVVTKGLNPKARMKQSKIEWVGEIPAHWEVKKLSWVFEVKGRIGWRGYTAQDLRDAGDGVLVLGATNITTNGQVDLSNPTYISKEKFEESPEIKLVGGELLIVKVGASIGKVGIVPNNFFESTINPNLMIARSEKVDSRYFHFLFRANVMQKIIGLEKMAGAQDAINQDFIGHLKILVPPNEEQRDIVDYLNHETSRIQNLIGRITDSIMKLQEYRSALISATVTGKIDVRQEA